MPEEIAGEGARRRPRGARGALVAAVGAAVIAGSGATPAAAEPPEPAPSLEPGEAAAPGADAGVQAPGAEGAADAAGVEGEVDAAGSARDLEPAVAYALRHLGDPYAYGGVGPRRWDCSGLVQQAYRRAGIRLPRIAADQYRATRRIPRSALRRGDLVFWSTDGKASGVHHVAIYVGGGRYIEAARPGTKVRLSGFSVHDPHLYGRPSPVRAKRTRKGSAR
ncbi:C40 family peptidase [Streptomyces sp. NPDC026206]|uniref:C40 family peptidase n=1 Tax=Streptomyces sp. NPDC026206 TaxID=3157089 RepID=UPI0033C1D119